MTLPHDWPGSIANPIEFLVYLNNATDHALGYGTLFALFLITFISLKNFDSPRAFATACWVTALCSYPFTIFTLIGAEVAALLTILAFTSVLFIQD